MPVRVNKGDRVRLLRDIFRVPSNQKTEDYTSEPTLYAKKGLEGIVLETFKSDPYDTRWFVKVLSDSQCYTFRLSSVEKLG